MNRRRRDKDAQKTEFSRDYLLIRKAPHFHIGQTDYLKTYPYQAAEIISIGWERKGRHIQYLMPKYRVKFIYTDQYMQGYTMWLGEHELDKTPNVFGYDDDDD